MFKAGDKVRVLKNNANGANVYKGQILIVSGDHYITHTDIPANSIEEYNRRPINTLWFFNPEFIELVEPRVIIKCEEDYYKWLAAR